MVQHGRERATQTPFARAADALAYMHEKRVMHRDIKPANVFVTEASHVKLGDLGGAAG